MYFFLIIIAVLLFGGSFLCTDIYRQMRGSTFEVSMQFSLIGSIVGLIVLTIINGIKFEYTHFSLIMALISTVNGIGFTFLGFKALNNINLSLFSLFSMLGGMMLPFLQGILFFNERLTYSKIICVMLITVALALTLSKGERKKGTIYYLGIFVLNGLSGVISKIFVSAPFDKVSSAGYSILTAMCSMVLSLVILLVFYGKKRNAEKIKFSSIAVAGISGFTNRIGNFLLIIALAHVDTSIQYPMVTGGTIIVSTLISFFGKRKPSGREIISVIVAFLGLLLLFVTSK